jgi:cobalt transporter subunit CbtA
VLAGLCAGLVYSAIQRFQVVPIIAAAEVFESALEREIAPDHNPSGTATHLHQDSIWQPQDGLERTFWTVVANVLGATGFALLLIPALAWWDCQRGGSAASIRSGLWWGGACWLCLFVWPAIGLRPELPGEAAAALHARQAWWLLAVVCAAAGLALLALLRGKWRWLGVPLLVLPFLVGAPHTEGPAFARFSGDAAAQMELLKYRFVVATSIASAVHWLVLGAASGIVVARWIRPILAPTLGSAKLPSVG